MFASSNPSASTLASRQSSFSSIAAQTASMASNGLSTSHNNSSSTLSTKNVRVLTHTHKSTVIRPSLYPVCSTLLKRLNKIPSLKPYLDACLDAYDDFRVSVYEICPNLSDTATMSMALASAQNSLATGSEEFVQQHTLRTKPYLASIGSIPLCLEIDPVSLLWSFFRMGSSLSALFNVLQPKTPLKCPIVEDMKLAKRSIYDFVHGCKEELNIPDHELFTISNVFSDNTSDLLKVIRTVNILMEALTSRGLISPQSEDDVVKDASFKDRRDKVIDEILQTERRYVQDLEDLVVFQNQVLIQTSLSQDEVHRLFANVTQLIDFQRRILVAFEYHAQLPSQQQRIGSVFEIMQDGFAVYEGYALNQKNALDLQIRYNDMLKNVLLPTGESLDLQAYLIKPIQRICKYPLLINELVKDYPKDWPYYREVLEGHETMKYITAEINETQRRIENAATVRQLVDQVRDWRGHKVEDFGELLHDGKFTVVKSDVEREYHLYLFENIILCCKPAPTSKKPTMRRGMSSTSVNVSPGGANNNQRESLVLKGRIYMAYITDVVATRSGGYMLHISWGTDHASDTGYFDIRFRHEEVLKQWETTIKRMLARYHEAEAASPEYLANYQPQRPRRSYGSDDEATELVSPSSKYEPSNGLLSGRNSQTSMSTVGLNGSSHGQVLDDFSGLKLSSSSGSAVGSAARTESTSTNASSLSSSSYSKQETGPLTAANVTSPYTTRTRSISSPNHANMPPPSIGVMNGMSNNTQNNVQKPASAQRAKSEGLGISTTGYSSARLGTMPAPITETKVLSGSSGATSPDLNMNLNGNHNGRGFATTASSASSMTMTNSQDGNIKLKLHYEEDTFLLIIPTSVDYDQLVERIERKIRLCGKQMSADLRLKYKDEDEDFVAIKTDEDLSMAMEFCQQEDLDVLEIWATSRQ